MGYIESNLMPNEEVIYTTKLHWIVFFSPLFWFCVGLFLYLYGDDDLRSLGIVLMFVSVVYGLSPLVNYWTSEFGITTRRVILKTGFIKRNTVEILLSKVESIQVHQSIPGRILGYGTIIIRGTGGVEDSFKNIRNPLKFKKIAQETIVATQENMRWR